MKKVKSNWNNVAEEYHNSVGDAGDVNHRKYLNPQILKLLGDINGKNILDLACGQGYFSRILADRGAKVIGIDASSKLIAIARGYGNRNNQKVAYEVANSADLKSIKDRSQDIIVSNVSFHDIEDLQKTVKECHRILKTSGKLVFSIVHPLKSASEKKQKDKSGYYIRMRGYLSQTSKPHFMYPAEKGIKIYHRPIGFYMDELFKNGFLVSGFKEITSRHSGGKNIFDDKLKVAYKKEFPLFLIVEAKKIFQR
jgi:2-polyprenyl-3-methyl-5-hydroxy-6-metoxy-1,4-benzoquinol methylase